MAYHLRSDLHARSVNAQEHQKSVQAAAERSMQEECEMEHRMEGVMFSSISFPESEGMAPTRVSPSIQEKAMWDSYDGSNQVFDAGIDHTAVGVEERKRLERECIDIDIWHATDFLPEEDPNNGELLLDELEQDDILTELLRNASAYFSFILSMYPY